MLREFKEFAMRGTVIDMAAFNLLVAVLASIPSTAPWWG